MNKRTILVVSLFVFLMIMPMVVGVNFLEQIFAPFKGVDVAQTYARYAPFIDAILYFWMFVALAQFALREKFKDAKGIAVVVGIILGIAMCIFEKTSGFNVGKLSWFAALIFFLVFGMAIYSLIKQIWNNNLAAFSLAFLIMYSLIMWAAPKLMEWVNKVGWLGTILSILMVVAIIGIIISIFGLVKGLKTGSFQLGQANRVEKEARNEEKKERKQEQKAVEAEKKAEQSLVGLDISMANLTRQIQELENIKGNLNQKELMDRAKQRDLLLQLEGTVRGSEAAQVKIQEALGKLNQPGYENFRDELKNNAKKLEQYVDLLTKILTGIKGSVEDSINDYRQGRKIEGDAAKICEQLNISEGNLLSVIKRFKDKETDLFAQSSLIQEVNTISTELERLNQIIVRVREIDNNIRKTNDSIDKLDNQNLKSLETAINVVTKDSLNDVNWLFRGFEALKRTYNTENYRNDWEYLKDIRKTLSSQSLGHIILAVGELHKNLSEILTLLPTVLQLEQQRKAGWDAIQQQEKTEIAATRTKINNLVQKIKQDYIADFNKFKTVKQQLDSMINQLSSGQTPTTIPTIPDFNNPGIKTSLVGHFNSIETRMGELTQHPNDKNAIGGLGTMRQTLQQELIDMEGTYQRLNAIQSI